MNVQELLRELPSRARGKRKQFQEAVRELRRLRAGELERRMNDLHDWAFSQVDCLDCGNCCRALGPRLIDRDITRLAKTLGVKTASVHSDYLRMDEDGDLVFRSMPCPFLGEDNFCAVYSQRPKACAEYPHTDGRQVRGRLDQLIKNSSYCPAVYLILDRISGVKSR